MHHLITKIWTLVKYTHQKITILFLWKVFFRGRFLLHKNKQCKCGEDCKITIWGGICIYPLNRLVISMWSSHFLDLPVLVLARMNLFLWGFLQFKSHSLMLMQSCVYVLKENGMYSSWAHNQRRFFYSLLILYSTLHVCLYVYMCSIPWKKHGDAADNGILILAL